MELTRNEDSISRRISAMCQRVRNAKEAGIYFYNMPITELRGGARVQVNGREMGMYASYSYLGLIGHPRINAAATAAVDEYGSGTHGVRSLAGSLDIHRELEATIAEFQGGEAAITFSSGYVTNLSVVSTLVGRHDVVFSDKLNHASIVDGCLLSGAKFVRFRHRDTSDLEAKLKREKDSTSKLIVSDAVFSMDGDIADLPKLVELCQAHGAWLMIDEAHSIGVLGKTGRGIEEHFGLEGAIDIKMGTLSKTIPSVGGYVAGSSDLIEFIRHRSRAYIFSAALPPAQVAASLASFQVIRDEPWRVEKVQDNAVQFIDGLKARGFNTLETETPIVPILCGSDELAFYVTREVHQEDVFVLPVVSPAVQEGQARLRATVTAAHEPHEIDEAMDVISRAGRAVGLVGDPA